MKVGNGGALFDLVNFSNGLLARQDGHLLLRLVTGLMDMLPIEIVLDLSVSCIQLTLKI